MADTVDEAIAELARVKSEHRGILRTIAEDEGMSGVTRATLVEHLYAEEDEHLAEIRALSTQQEGSPSARSAPSSLGAESAPAPARLTVGGLREAPPPSLVLGGLRPRAAMGPSPSVGSLRRT